MTKNELIQQFNNIVGTKRVLTKLTQTAYYRSGFRSANVVVFFVQSLNKAYNSSKNIPDCA